MESRYLLGAIFVLFFVASCRNEILVIEKGAKQAEALELVVEPRYVNASNWTQFVRRADYLTACDGSETGEAPCEHGGDKKKVVVSAASSCAGLSMRDQLGAFYWYCEVVSGKATFYSALRQDKTLGHLLNSLGWFVNKVILSGTYSGESELSAWWSNPIEEAYDNSIACVPGANHGCHSDNMMVQLNDSNRIYIISSTRDTRGYQITANNVALAMLPGVYLAAVHHGSSNCDYNGGADDAFCTVFADSAHMLWIEGKYQFSANGNDPRATGPMTFPLYIQDSNLSIYRHLHILISNDDGMFLHRGASNYFSHFKVSNTGWAAWIDDDTSSGLADYNRFDFVIFNNSSIDGYYISRSNHLRFNTHSVVEGNKAMQLHSGAIQTGYNIHNFLGFSSNQQVFELRDATAMNLSQVAVFSSGAGAGGLSMQNISASKFTGNILMGNNTADCGQVGAPSPLDGGCVSIDGVSDANVIQGLGDVSTSFVGNIVNDDENPDEDPAGQMLGALHGNDWSNFESFFRFWGANASFPNNAQCPSAGSCQLQDISLDENLTIIRNSTDTGNSSNGAGFVIGANCPAAVHGNKTLTHVSGGQYLKNAVEIDGHGDGDGLCESSETCMYTPNFGAYQGHGDFGQCRFTNGSIVNVIMFGYAINGR